MIKLYSMTLFAISTLISNKLCLNKIMENNCGRDTIFSFPWHMSYCYRTDSK